MLDFYDFMELCRDEGLSPEDALDEWDRARAAAKEKFLEDYYDNPETQYGWYQQDLIDMYRREK